MADPLSSQHLTPQQTRPAGLDLDLKAQVLRITWSDGVTSNFPAAFLRKHCPCATCRTEREKQTRSLLPILSRSTETIPQATNGSMVGNYALLIEWSDGHNTGIYDFRLLRALHDQIPR